MGTSVEKLRAVEANSEVHTALVDGHFNVETLTANNGTKLAQLIFMLLRVHCSVAFRFTKKLYKKKTKYKLQSDTSAEGTKLPINL